MTARRHDIIIVGGGPVGASLALALASSGLDVLTIDSRARDAQPTDTRSLALSWGSRLILERIGVWQRCAPHTAISTIHVSQRGGMGRAVLDAREVDLPALGYVVGYASLHHALAGRLRETHAAVLYATTVSAVNAVESAISVQFVREGRHDVAQASLLVIADGGGNLGAQAGASTHTRDYAQVAVVANVSVSTPHRNRAFERFTPDGPVALLPHGSQYALVWSAKPEQARSLLELDDARFLQRLQAHFGDRAGRFVAVTPRASFPLSLRVARSPSLDRVLLLGNAAQTLHPIAGQGFNLGLRDAWTLAEMMQHRPLDADALPAIAAEFRRARRPDRFAGIGMTDALATIFSNDLPPLRAARGMGLFLLDLLPPAKRMLMRRMIFGS
jgi:2-octaprenyl-6-methoxyphenol hydroxylase